MWLEKSEVFRGVSGLVRGLIEEIVVEESYPKGAFVFRRGEPCQSLFLLQEGRVRLSVGEGGRIAHSVSEIGEAMGWSSMTEMDFYTASAECLEPVRVVRLDRTRLLQILEENPSAGLVFFRGLAKVIGRRLVESYGGTLSVHGDRDAQSYG